MTLLCRTREVLSKCSLTMANYRPTMTHYTTMDADKYYELCKDRMCCRLGNEHPDCLHTSPECQVARLNVAFVHTRPYTRLSHHTSSASSLCSRFPFFPLASRLPFLTRPRMPDR